ncbi:MAG TPA: Gfo/Idh/MocA family oxidoreductase [Bryobacteraceae bacterium]|jgi:predicted dehydrogenase|nr:Gfo/Idh/MocA family oxidoreductase [Bryobacteraceae bacterium]
MDSIGIILNGVTGRMGTNQHLKRSLVPIREAGGVLLSNGRRVTPELLLVGRNETKLRALAEECGIARWSTDLAESLRDPQFQIYFDAQTTSQRVPGVKRALAAGKHVYCEKPLAENLDDALELARLARRSGLKHGIVQDKLFLPGLRKLKQLIENGFFGRILAVRGEFGYWVFEGDDVPAQRPSWNYRKEDGGGITLDMFGHWQYVFENLFGRVERLSARALTHIPQRVDEGGARYECTADDAVYAFFELENGAVIQMNSSWATRVNRDDLLTLQVDGTEGSAVAGLRDCKIQSRKETPRAVWNPDLAKPIDYLAAWQPVEAEREYENAFKVQWEMFLRHVLENAPFPHDFLSGAKGVQLAELGLESSASGCSVPVPELGL